MENTKQYSGRVSRVGPQYILEGVGIQFMIEGSSEIYTIALRYGYYHLGMTKIGDLVSFKFKETGIFKKEFKFDQTTVINHTLDEECKASKKAV